MSFLASLFVGKPLTILLVALCFAIAAWALRNRAPGARRMTPLVITAAAWVAYAAWEWLVVTRTPEADIRVDLLLIWPILALLVLWSIYRLLRPKHGPKGSTP